MVKLLEVSLYNGDSNWVELDLELNEYLYLIMENGDYSNKGDREVWLGEEFMYIKLSN